MGQSVPAFVTATLLITVGALAVALFAEPPMLFEMFPPLPAGIVLSFGIGIAAAPATADDAGHRQLIGLAAASQLALVPAWFGISIVFGFREAPLEKLAAFGLNTLGLLAGAAVIYGALLLRGEGAQEPAAMRRQYRHDS